MTTLLVRGDACRLPIADASIHCCVTSPPYFGLRSYMDSSDPAKRLELGAEPTPDEFVAAMVGVFREVRRVMRQDATLWLNLGDSYNASPPGNKKPMSKSGLNGAQTSASYRARLEETQQRGQEGRRLDRSLKPKDLLMIPARVALALQADGWYLRAAPPWIKRCPMPESVEDRPGTAHESVFLLTKSPRYYYDRYAVMRGSAATTLDRDRYTRITSGKDGPYAVQHDHETPSHPAGRNWRTSDVFLDSLDGVIASQRAYLSHLESVRDRGGMLVDDGGDPLAFLVNPGNYAGAHFATMPVSLVEPCILAGSSEAGCCAKCSAPLRRVVVKERIAPPAPSGMREIGRWSEDQSIHVGDRMRLVGESWRASCPCFAGETIPCRVLDPFAGSGTTLQVARWLGRDGIGLDLNASYLELARGRIARPRDAESAVKSLPGQAMLFGEGR